MTDANNVKNNTSISQNWTFQKPTYEMQTFLFEQYKINNSYNQNLNIFEPASANTKQNITDEQSIKTTYLDDGKNLINSCTPSWATDLIPEDFLEKQANKHMLRNQSKNEIIKDLPKNADGSINAKELKRAFTLAIQYIKGTNEKAASKIEYGIYKQQLNNIDPLVAFLGPEGVAVARKCGMPDCSTGYGIHDAASAAPETLKYLGIQNDSLDAISKEMTIVSSDEIKANIKKQNDELDKILELPLDSMDSINLALDIYKKATGTTFSYTGTLEAINTLSNEKNSNEKKLEVACANFGIPQNNIDATANKIATDAYFKTYNTVSSQILQSNPYTRGVGYVTPFLVELAETYTKGAKEGEIINMDQVTYENTMNALFDGACVILTNKVIGKICNSAGCVKTIGEKIGIGDKVCSVLGFFEKLGIKAGIRGTIASTRSYICETPKTTTQKVLNGIFNPLYQAKFIKDLF